MKKLDIVFTKSKKKFALGSWLIRWWTKQPYSHVAKKFDRQDWGAGYYQASEGKVNYEHESVFNKKHEIIKSYPMMIEKELDMAIKEACWKECGNDYGLMQNVGIVLVDCKLFSDTPWKKGRNCSEILYLTIFKTMIPELEFNPDTIKPHQIEEIIIEYFVEKDGFWYLK